MTAPCENRWIIKGKIMTLSSMHIGDGESTTREDLIVDDKPVLINSFTTDLEGKPYIPGSAFRGIVRSWLYKQTKLDQAELNNIFGDDDNKGEDFVGGKVDFTDAVFHGCPEWDSITEPPYWSDERKTGVTTSVVIDRSTRTALEKRLFYTEYIPSGAEFVCEIVCQDMSDNEIAALLFGLEKAFNHCTLGASSADGWGRYKWETLEIRQIDREAIARWAKGKAESHWSDAAEEVTVSSERYLNIREITKELTSNNRSNLSSCASAGIALHFDYMFLVNDPTRTGESPLPSHYPRIDTNGRVYLPAESISGALRAQAERIIRTIDGFACTPLAPCDPPKTPSDVDNLCIVCRLFGATGWWSVLQFTDFVETTASHPVRQEFVAIDRFTGGGLSGAKFNADAAEKPLLIGNIKLDLSRCRWWDCLGLLILLFRDLKEGDITFGWGASKGYGACTMDIEELKIFGDGFSKEIRELLDLVGCNDNRDILSWTEGQINDILSLILPIQIKGGK